MTKFQLALAAMQEFCDRVDRGEVRSKRTYAKFKEILAMDGPNVGDGTGDAALAIGEHAFRAGWDAAVEAGPEWDDLFHGVSDTAKEKAWDAYDPPEDIKALS